MPTRPPIEKSVVRISTAGEQFRSAIGTPQFASLLRQHGLQFGLRKIKRVGDELHVHLHPSGIMGKFSAPHIKVRLATELKTNKVLVTPTNSDRETAAKAFAIASHLLQRLPMAVIQTQVKR